MSRLSSSEYSRRWRIKHPKEHRDKVYAYLRKKRIAAIAILGGVCCKCGFSDIRALQIDHINGGGRKELHQNTGATYYNAVIKSVIENEKKYQLLCANCNWIKKSSNKYENGGRPIIL